MMNYFSNKKEMKKGGARISIFVKMTLLLLVLSVVFTGMFFLSSKSKEGKRSKEASAFTIVHSVYFHKNKDAVYPKHYGIGDQFVDEQTGGIISLTYSENDSLLCENFSKILTVGEEHAYKKDYYFKGWYSPVLKKIIDINTQKADSNIYSATAGHEYGLIAWWEYNPDYKITVDYGIGGEPSVYSLKANDSIPAIADELTDFSITDGLPENEESVDFIFKGWYKNDNFLPANKIETVSDYIDLEIPESNDFQYYFFTTDLDNKCIHLEGHSVGNSEVMGCSISTDIKIYALWEEKINYKDNGSGNGNNENNGSGGAGGGGSGGENGNNGGSGSENGNGNGNLGGDNNNNGGSGNGNGNGGGAGTDNGNGSETDNNNNAGKGSGSETDDKNDSGKNDKNTDSENKKGKAKGDSSNASDKTTQYNNGENKNTNGSATDENVSSENSGADFTSHFANSKKSNEEGKEDSVDVNGKLLSDSSHGNSAEQINFLIGLIILAALGILGGLIIFSLIRRKSKEM